MLRSRCIVDQGAQPAATVNNSGGDPVLFVDDRRVKESADGGLIKLDDRTLKSLVLLTLKNNSSAQLLLLIH